MDRMRALACVLVALVLAGCGSGSSGNPSDEAAGAGKTTQTGPATSTQTGGTDVSPTTGSGTSTTGAGAGTASQQGNSATHSTSTQSTGGGTQAPTCIPGYTYSSWVAEKEERWYQDTWVLQRLYYARTSTDSCTGATATERKVEGPFRLWQSVPDERVADVNRSQGSTEGLSGSPLRSSDLPFGPDPASVGPADVPKAIDPAKVPESPGIPVPAVPGLLLSVGAFVALMQARRRKRMAEQSKTSALKADGAKLRELIVGALTGTARLGDLSLQLKELSVRIEQDRQQIPSDSADVIFKEELGDIAGPATELIASLKHQQYVDLARRGQFDMADPQLKQDPQYQWVGVLWPVLDQGRINGLQKAWKETAVYWRAVFAKQGAGDPPSGLPEVNQIALETLAVRYRNALTDAWAKVQDGGPDPRTIGYLNQWEQLLQGNTGVSEWARLVNQINGQIRDAHQSKQAALKELQGSLDANGVGAVLNTIDTADQLQAAAALWAANVGVAAVQPKPVDFSGALRDKLLNFVHQKWQDREAGRLGAEQDLTTLMNETRVPADIRAAMQGLDDAYSQYWQATEQRYQAIIRQDAAGLNDADVARASIAEAAVDFGGVKMHEIKPLRDKYQPIINAMYQQAELVAATGDDGEYAKLLEMVILAEAGNWGGIMSAIPRVGSRLDALWSRDATQKAKGKEVAKFLAQYLAGPESTSAAVTQTQTDQPASTGGDGWTWPSKPFKLGGNSAAETWLTEQIDGLNGILVPRAARFVVRNRKIVALKEAGNPPTAEVPLPPATDPEVQDVVKQLTWNQDKINQVWDKAKQFGIDPRIMLAVILQEGTGSFDTNADVPVQFWKETRYVSGGSGAQPDFKTDLDAAMEAHILAKVQAYGYYAKDFRTAVVAAGLGDGNVFQYCNYNVPWVKRSGWTVTPGCYATDTTWWSGVSKKFDGLAGPGATSAYSNYLASHPLAADSPPPAVQFFKTDGGTGENEEITGQPWIEARP